jgi:hypothetical protein
VNGRDNCSSALCQCLQERHAAIACHAVKSAVNKSNISSVMQIPDAK